MHADAKRRASKLTNRQYIAGDKGCAVYLRLVQFPSLSKFLQEVESFFHCARRRRSEIRFHSAQVINGVDIIPRSYEFVAYIQAVELAETRVEDIVAAPLNTAEDFLDHAVHSDQVIAAIERGAEYHFRIVGQRKKCAAYDPWRNRWQVTTDQDNAPVMQVEQMLK